VRRGRPGRGDGRRAPQLSDPTLRIRLQPRAGRNEIAGERAGAIVVRVTAPPVEDRANEALCKLIAKRLGVGRGRVSVVKGQRSRDKTIHVEGVAPEAARRTLLGA
jgi:uncharacterized protein